MSQAAVEEVLGRLLTDPAFRGQFYAGECDDALRRYPLTAREVDGLKASRLILERHVVRRVASGLDPAICRADLRAAVLRQKERSPA